MMRYLLFVVTYFCFAVALLGQEKIAGYESASGDLKIEASEPNEAGEFNFYIETQTWANEKFKLIISTKAIDAFKKFILNSKEEYLKQKEYAERAGFEKMNKLLIDGEEVYQGAFYIGKWHYSEAVKLKTMFALNGKEALLIIQNSNEVRSEIGQFTSTHKFVIAFEEEEQINAFLSKLDESVVHEKFKNME